MPTSQEERTHIAIASENTYAVCLCCCAFRYLGVLLQLQSCQYFQHSRVTVPPRVIKGTRLGSARVEYR